MNSNNWFKTYQRINDWRTIEVVDPISTIETANPNESKREFADRLKNTVVGLCYSFSIFLRVDLLELYLEEANIVRKILVNFIEHCGNIKPVTTRKLLAYLDTDIAKAKISIGRK